MPLSKLVFRPGIVKDATSYSNEGGFFACDKVRFRSGFAEKIGGWINQNISSTFQGVCRSLFNWVSLSNENLLGVGTNQRFYVEADGIYHNITPTTGTVTLPTDPFTTVNGSYLVTVTTSTSHGLFPGTYVTFAGVSGGGTVNGIELSGSTYTQFEVLTTPSNVTFTIVGYTLATSSGSGGGSSATAQFEISAGSSVYTEGAGWGSGAWGYGGWGIGGAVADQLRLWSQDNDKENLLFNPRGGPIYYWVKDTSSWARGVTLNSYANTITKTTTQATFSSGVSSITVVDPNSITSGAVISGTGIAAGTYVTTSYVNGSNIVPISTPTTGASSGDYNFSYAGRHVPNSTFKISTSSVGNFAIAFGANKYNPNNFAEGLDPLLIRWSDFNNPLDWVPTSLNQSGETRLSYGSYIVASVDTRQEILVWTDAAIFSMQYLGPPYVWSVNILMDNISIISPNAAIAVNNVTYWMGVDKFYRYSGRVETLPCSIRKFIFSDINTEQQDQVVCGTNEGYNEVWWFYPSANSITNDRYVVYNHLENTWYYGNLHRGFWLDSPLRQYPMAAFSIQQSYLSTAVTDSDTILPMIDSASYPSSGVITIDSEQIAYTGYTSNSLTGCIRGYNGTTAASHAQYARVIYSVPNQVMNHEYGNDDRSTSATLPIESYIESSDFDIGDGESLAYVWRILPDLTFVNSSVENPTVTLTLKARLNSGSNYVNGDEPVVEKTATIPVEQYTGQVYTRIRGRQMAFRLASSDLGVAWQMGAMRIDIKPDGRR